MPPTATARRTSALSSMVVTPKRFCSSKASQMTAPGMMPIWGRTSSAIYGVV
jgi:hypothetical protein